MIADSGNSGLIIWPIAQKLFANPVMLQQQPKWTGGLRIPKLPVLPWAESDRPPSINYGLIDKAPIAASYLPSNFGLCAIEVIPIPSSQIVNTYYSNSTVTLIPGVIHEIKPLPATVFIISGISKDNTGVVLANCNVSLFRVDYDSGNNKIYTYISSIVSDVNGFYEFGVNTDDKYMVTALKNTVGGITTDNQTGVNS